MTATRRSATAFALLFASLFLSKTHGFVKLTCQGRPTRFLLRTPFSRTKISAVQDLLTDEFSAELAHEAKGMLKIPFLPDPLVVFLLTQAIGNMSKALSKDTLEKLNEMLDAESTASDFDDTPAKERDALADQIARELNPTIDVPVFDEEQELKALQQIMRVVLMLMTTTDQERMEATMEMEVEMTRNLLHSKSSRKKLVKTINEAVDIPLLDESQEQALLETAINSVADTLESLLPPQLLDTLKGANPNGIAETKSYVVDSATEKVKIVGLNDEQERVLITAMVDILVDTYVDDTEVEFLAMTAKQQKQELSDRVKKLENELEQCQRRFEREQEGIQSQIKRVETRMKKVKKGWFSFFRRK